MKNIQNLIIDINKKPFQTMTANQGEVGSRFIRINIIDNGLAVDLTGITTYLYAKKCDSKKVFNSVTVEDAKNGIVLAELSSQILVLAGIVKLTLLLVKDGSKLCSKQFLLNVDSSIVDDEAIESTNEFTALTDALGKVNDIDNKFDSVNSQINAITKPTISFCFDDGYTEDNLTYSIFKEYDMTCSFALITEYALARNKLGLYRQYEKEGFSINSHSCTHEYLGDGTVSDNIANYEIAESKKHMNLWGFSSNGFVAGQSVVDEKYIPTVKSNYDYAFSQYWGTLNTSNKGYCDNKTDVYKLGRVSLYRNTIEQIKECIDNCIENNGCLFFYDHRTGADGENVSVSKLREILIYVKSKINNKECVVKNNDDAITSYFSVNLSNKINSNIAYNLVASLDSTSNSLDFNAWWLSKHALDLGETYSFENGVGKITYPNNITNNKENSLQSKIDVSNIDFNDYKNQSITICFDMWAKTDANIKVTLESRFYKGVEYDSTHVKELEINTKRSTFEITISPLKKDKFDYLLLYPRIKFLEDVNANFEIFISDIKVGMTNKSDFILENKISNLISGKAYTKTLDITNIANRVWSKYSSTVDNLLYEGIMDDTGTVKIKNKGKYMITFEGFYKLEGVTSNSRVIARVLKESDKSIESNYRTTTYVNGTTGAVSLGSSYIIECNKNDKISIDVFLDSTVGTISELEKARIRVELISE